MDDNYRDYRGGNTLGTFLMGALIGAAAVLWARDDTRQMIKDKMSDWKDMGKDKMKQGKKKLAEGLDTAKQKLEE